MRGFYVVKEMNTTAKGWRDPGGDAAEVEAEEAGIRKRPRRYLILFGSSSFLRLPSADGVVPTTREAIRQTFEETTLEAMVG